MLNVKVHDSTIEKTEQVWHVLKGCPEKASSLYKEHDSIV